MNLLQTFEQNDRAKKTLLDMVQKKRISHAVLLVGPKGVGKKTFARLMATAILCEHDEPCFSCPSCKKVLAGSHPDVTEVFEHTKARSFTVDEVRTIRREAYISPNESEKRVFILANTENMGTEGQNALLKIIEEPPQHAVFILTVEDTSQLLPTVLSRVITVPINPVDDEIVKRYLKEKHPELDEQIKDLIATVSQGSIGRALEIADSDALKKTAETALEIIKSVTNNDRYESLRLLSSLSQSNELPDALDFMAAILQNTLSRKKSATTAKVSGSTKRLMKMLQAVMFAKNSLTFNANKALLTTGLCVKMYG